MNIYKALDKCSNSTLNELSGAHEPEVPGLYTIDNHYFRSKINLTFRNFIPLSIKFPLTIKSHIFYIHPFALLNQNPHNCQLSSDLTAISVSIVNAQIGIRLWVL